MQQRNFLVANDIVLNHVRVYHEKVYTDNVVSKFRFVMSFSSQHHCKRLASIATGNVAQVRTKNFNTISFV